jgi:hypothetical protein
MINKYTKYPSNASAGIDSFCQLEKAWNLFWLLEVNREEIRTEIMPYFLPWFSGFDPFQSGIQLYWANVEYAGALISNGDHLGK